MSLGGLRFGLSLVCLGLRLATCFGLRDEFGWATIWFELGVSWFEILVGDTIWFELGVS